MVLLVAPNCKQLNYGVTSGNSAIQPNIYMAILDSYFNKVKKVSCDMLNLEAEGLSNEEGAELIIKMQPQTVGVICSGSNPSASTMTMPGAVELCKAIKKRNPKIKIFLYGGHPTVLPDRSKMETGADEVIIGDGLECLIADIPIVDWKRINPKKYRAHNWHCWGQGSKEPYAVVYTSLGCPYSCKFCCVNNLFGGRTYKTRQMKDVVAEIVVLSQEFGVRNIKIMDELFVNTPSRVFEFCDLLEKHNLDLNMWCFARTDTVTPKILERLKAVGVNWVAYGFETTNQRTLNSMNKGAHVGIYEKVIEVTKNAGLNIIADVIAGFEDDDINSLNDMYGFLVKHDFDFINLYPLFAFPGTRLFSEAIKNKTISFPDRWEKYSLFGEECEPMPTKHLTSAEVLKWRDDMFGAYLRRPEYLNRMENKFGVECRSELVAMSLKKPKRNLNADVQCSYTCANKIF